VKAIMCEVDNCDYPVTEKETKKRLEWVKNEFQRNLKEHTGDEQWVKMVYEKIIDDKVSEKCCTLCAVKCFMMTLFFEKDKEDSKLIILDIGLSIVSRFAIAQHVETVTDDLSRKSKKTSNNDWGDLVLWLTLRLRRFEYKQSQHVKDEEREIMRGMRGKGESLRDLAYIFDRSLSTVQQNCQDVEVVKKY
jgi:hypothetical protein